MNKTSKMLIAVFLGALIVTLGNKIGGGLGNFVTILGGIGAVYAVVDNYKKK